MNQDIVAFLRYIEVEKGYSKETVKGYERDLLLFHSFLKQENISHLKKVDYSILRMYLMSLYEKKYSKKTISRVISSLRSFFKYLVRENKIDTDPCVLLSNPKLDKRLPNYVNYKELDQLMNSVDTSTPLGKRDALILEMLYSTGIRVSELVDIKLSDVIH